MGTAAVFGSWFRRGRYALPSVKTAGPAMGGVPFLQNSPAFAARFPNAKLSVEWAPYAPSLAYGDDSTGWPWEDITSDVMQANSGMINISPMGRSDAVSEVQPAGCSFTVDNTAGKYSLGPQNPYYPNVKLNVPIRVCISLSGDPKDKVVRFQGYAWAFEPSWDETGRYAVVQINSSGVTRRLQQKSTPLRSPLYRQLTHRTGIASYWPMEDETGSLSLASAISTGVDASFTNLTLSNYTAIPGSLAIPTMSASTTMAGNISSDNSGTYTFVFYLNCPTAPASDTAIIRIFMTNGSSGSSGVARWELTWAAGSNTSMKVNGFASDNTLNLSDTRVAPFNTAGTGPIQYVFAIHQNGSNIEYTLSRGGILFSGGTTATNTVAGTIGRPVRWDTPAATGLNGMSLGHLGVLNTYSQSVTPLPAQGWVGDGGDSAVSRVIGLSSEEGVPVRWNGSNVESSFPYTNYATGDYTWVGYQGEQAYVDLVRAASDADLGFLGDGLGPGILYRNRATMYNQSPKMTLDISNDEVQPPFTPVGDDQTTINKVTVTKSGGSSSVWEDDTGVLGTAEIGIYDDSSTVLVRYDEQTLDIAGWLVHLGTAEGYRYPTLSLDMRKIPVHAAEWLSVLPGDKISIANISSWITQHPTGTINLLVEGWSEQITNLRWDVTLNCVPGDVWNAIELGTDLGSVASDSANVRRVDSDASTVNGLTLAGATSLSVSTASNAPLWTTSATNFPFDLSVGGWRVTCTAISSTSSPQTFTISALPANVVNGATVKLWTPAILTH